MKGNLRNPRPIRGLDASIRENEALYFYVDVVNNRNLKADEFFEYLTKKYSPKGDLWLKIDSLSKRLSPFRAEKVNIIIQYKRAESRNKIEQMIKLQNNFNKIGDVQISETEIKKNEKKTYIKTFDEENKKDDNKIKVELEQFLDDYLNDKKSFTEKEVYNYNQRLLNHISTIDQKKYIAFLIKSEHIKSIDFNEIDQVIEVLNYFIKNLNTTKNQLEILDYVVRLRLDQINDYDKEIKLLKSYLEKESNSDVQSIINASEELKVKSNEILDSCIEKVNSVYILGEENISPSITNNIKKLLIWKIQKIESYLTTYNRILNKLLEFKNIIETNDKDSLKEAKIYKVGKADIEESFIVETLKSISEALNSYRKVCNINISDAKLDEMKDYYIEKVYTNKRGY